MGIETQSSSWENVQKSTTLTKAKIREAGACVSWCNTFFFHRFFSRGKSRVVFKFANIVQN